jgi:hypothetical protein
MFGRVAFDSMRRQDRGVLVRERSALRLSGLPVVKDQHHTHVR